MIARPDYYVGRVGMRIRFRGKLAAGMLDDNDDNAPDENPKPGELHFTLLSYSLAMHQLREEAIKSMAAATADGISSYEVQKYRSAM
jgi:hypothetical protein